MGISLLGQPASRIYNPKHISTFSTIGSTITGDRRTFSLMSFKPLAPTFVPHYQLPSDPPISLCNSNTMRLPLAEISEITRRRVPETHADHPTPLTVSVSQNVF